MYLLLSALVVILVVASTESILYGIGAAMVLYGVSLLYRAVVQDAYTTAYDDDDDEWEDDESEVSIARDAEFEVVPTEEEPVVDPQNGVEK